MESLSPDQLAYIKRHGKSKNPTRLARDLKVEVKRVQDALRTLKDPEPAPATPPVPAPQAVSSTPPAPAPRERSSWLLGIVCVLAIVLAGIAIYSNNLHDGWHFDDTPSILQNDAVHAPSVKAIYQYNLFRQVLYWSFAWSWSRYGPSVVGWHVENDAIHVVNGLLVFFVSLLTLWTPGGRKCTRWPVLVSGAAALVFVAHPLQTQAVTYITQRTESLCSGFYLLALLLYAAARLRRERGHARGSAAPLGIVLASGVAFLLLAAIAFGRPQGGFLKPFLIVSGIAVAGSAAAALVLLSRRRIDPIETLLLGGALLATFAAMETKEIAGTLPTAIVLWELLFMRAPRATTAERRQTWFERHAAVAPFLAFFVLLPVLAIRVGLDVRAFLQEGVEKGSNARPIEAQEYILTELNVLATYVRLYLYPSGQTLDYDYPKASSLAGPTWASLVALVSILGVAWMARKRLPVLTWGILLGLIVLAPTSSIFVLPDFVYEHRLYLPIAGAALVTAVLLEGVLRRFLSDRVARGVFVALSVPLIVVLGSLAFERNKVWASELTLWQDAVSKAENKPRPHTDLGLAYENTEPQRMLLSDGEVVAGEVWDGDAQAGASTKGFWIVVPTLNPFGPQKQIAVRKSDVVKGPEDWGGVLRAIEQYKKALEIDPGYYKARNNLALCRIQIQATNLIVQAQSIRQDLAQASPEQQAQGQKIIDRLETEATKDLLEGRDDLALILRDHPDDPLALSNMGSLLLAYLDDLDGAVAAMKHSLEVDDKEPIGYATLGECYFHRGVVRARKGTPEDLKAATADFLSAYQAYTRFLERAPGDERATHIAERCARCEQLYRAGGVGVEEADEGTGVQPRRPEARPTNDPQWRQRFHPRGVQPPR